MKNKMTKIYHSLSGFVFFLMIIFNDKLNQRILEIKVK